MLKINNLNISFGGIKAIHDLSFSTNPGTIHSLIGPNGAGKSTCVNLITGFYQPDSGIILIDENGLKTCIANKHKPKYILVSILSGLVVTFLISIQSIWKILFIDNFTFKEKYNWIALPKNFISAYIETFNSTSLILLFVTAVITYILTTSIKQNFLNSSFTYVKKGITRTFQNIRLFPSLSVLENVEIVNSSNIKSIDLLKMVELEKYSELPATSLSYGNQRKLEIARALALSPKLLLLDEPAAGMNPSEVNQLKNILNQIKQSGISILLVEHNMSLVMDISDEISVLNFGHLLCSGTPNEIQNNEKVIEAYLGK